MKKANIVKLQNQEMQEWQYLEHLQSCYRYGMVKEEEVREQRALWCGYYRALEILGIETIYRNESNQ